jgi:hypothetical protein
MACKERRYAKDAAGVPRARIYICVHPAQKSDRDDNHACVHWLFSSDMMIQLMPMNVLLRN